ncbi:MAG: 6-hydroxymethylpterin diphosphokinase MptE-like protein [Phycisphaeraceae bacterium]
MDVTFSLNLAALGQSNPAFAARLASTEPAKLDWLASRGGPLTASLSRGERTVSYASRFDPSAEAEKLIAHVDLCKHACVAMLGFGLGYHVDAIARRISEDSLLIIFEPDLAVLRSVLERIDYTKWLGRSCVIFADSSTDRAALLTRVERDAALLTQGTVIVTHPPSRSLHGEAMQTFGTMLTEVTSFCRTNVATALVNATRTYSNLSRNLSHYVAGATTNDLHQAAKGFPAVCVSAGPSLAKNIQLLADPKVRRNIIVITAQTTLKPLLDRGIRPDFVTALDYHEISRRFYEGLPELPDVTLVAEPKANPTILDSFPGPVRLTQSGFLDVMCGPLKRERVPIASGATVAHLSFYLAQHLGCDPIIMIGQDLGFSDGLYYCPGTAIHDVWANELGTFNSLEMMEWQRIVRHRRHLQKFDDIHGKPIYSDEQMVTYLKQFERDFARAPQLVLDATEGGMKKAGTTVIALAEALRQYATRPVPTLPLPSRQFDPDQLEAAVNVIQQRIGDVHELDRIAESSLPILRQMLEHQRDGKRFNKLFARLQANKEEVDKRSLTFGLVNDLNTVGVFRRARADRAIQFDEAHETDPLARQRRQIERDIDNIEWLRQAYVETLGIFEAALERAVTHRNESAADLQPTSATTA